MDCLFSLLDSKIKCINLDKIILSNGLANNFRTIAYSQELIYINDGRGFLDSLSILDRLKINYIMSSVCELKKENSNIESYIVFMPKTLLDRNRKPNLQVRHFYPFYSAFAVKNIKKDMLVLEVAGEGTEENKIFEVTWDDFEMFSTLYSLPISKTVFIVKLDLNSNTLNEKEIIEGLLISCKRFLTDNIKNLENTQCRSGPQFYEIFIRQIENFVNESKQKFTRKEFLKQYIFASSINVGSIGFYRKDFAKTLNNSFINQKNNLGLCIDNLSVCSNGWREIGRSLKEYQFKEKSFDTELYDKISNIIHDISLREITAINNLYAQLLLQEFI